MQPTSILRGSRGRGGPLRPFSQTPLGGSCPSSPYPDRCMPVPPDEVTPPTPPPVHLLPHTLPLRSLQMTASSGLHPSSLFLCGPLTSLPSSEGSPPRIEPRGSSVNRDRAWSYRWKSKGCVFFSLPHRFFFPLSLPCFCPILAEHTSMAAALLQRGLPRQDAGAGSSLSSLPKAAA